MGSDDDFSDIGGSASQRKLDAQASTMKGGVVKLRRKDSDRKRRIRARQQNRKFLKSRNVALLVGSILGLIVSAVLLYYHFHQPDLPQYTASQLKASGHFKCEACGATWEGEAKVAHPFDPYIKCPKCHERTMRMATRCPQCAKWVLDPLPVNDKPFEKMTRNEYHRWQLEKRVLAAKALCPECGALLHPDMTHLTGSQDSE